MKKGAIIVGSLMLLAAGLCVNAAVPVTVQELKTLTPVETYYTGEVESIEKATYSFTNAGLLKSIVQVGQYVFAPIYDMDGKVVRPGTILAEQDATENITNFLSKKKELESLDMIIAKKGQLYNTSANELYKKRLELKKAENDIKLRKLVSSFSGVVTKVYMSEGTRAADGGDAVEVTKMNPMLVKIPFPIDVIDNFKEGTQANFYPAGVDTPVSGWCATSLNNDMIYAYVPNCLISTLKLTPEQEKMKKALALFPVIKLSDSYMITGKFEIDVKFFKLKDNPLAVPVLAINKDDKGDFVLIVNRDDREKMYKDPEGLDNFRIQKIYVDLGNIEREFDLGVGREMKIRALKNAADLKDDDTIVIMTPEAANEVTDGESVVKENMRWQFRPGDNIVISIPSISAPGIYVTPKSIIHEADGSNYVYLVKNGKTKLVRVRIIGRASGFDRIVGDGIEDGAQVLVLDRENQFAELWDGLAVDVTKTLPSPERITKDRVDKLDINIADIAKGWYK